MVERSGDEADPVDGGGREPDPEEQAVVAETSAPEPEAERRRAAAWAASLHRWYLPVMLGASLALAAAAVWGLPLLGVAALGVAVVVDAAGTFSRTEPARWLDRTGADPRTRALLRALAVTALLAVGSRGSAPVVLAYAAAVVVAQACWLSMRRSFTLVLSAQPILGVRNIGTGLALRTVFTRAAHRRLMHPYLLLGVDWAIVAVTCAGLAGPRAAAVAVVAAGVGSVVMLALAARAEWWSWRLRSGGSVQRYEQALLAELAALRPQVIVYVAAATGESYMYNQWLPAFEPMGTRAFILVREPVHLEAMVATGLPVLYAPTTRDVERLVLPSVRLAFYVANAGKNVHLLREPGLRHVFLNHGDSDKSTSANPVVRVYNEVWVAGAAAIDRYEAAGIDLPRTAFAVVGRPQVDGLPVGRRGGTGPACVLYAPTFEGYYEESNYSSLEAMGPALVRRLLRERPDVNIVFKPHPSTGRMRPGMRRARQEVMRLLRDAPEPSRHVIAEDHEGMTLFDCFALADVLVSDVSSVVTDFLHTERPIITSNPKQLSADRYAEMFPTQRSSYILDADLGNLLGLLDQALGPDPLFEARRQMKLYVLGDVPEGPLRAFAANTDRAYAQAVADAARIRNDFRFSDKQVAQGVT